MADIKVTTKVSRKTSFRFGQTTLESSSLTSRKYLSNLSTAVNSTTKEKPKTSLPNFQYERELWEQNKKVVVGADEVGRGALAGPVVTAAVCFMPGVEVSVEINDSKKLTSKKREHAAVWIKEHSSWAIAHASSAEIDQYGIVPATHKAYRRALVQFATVDHLLLDAFYVPYTPNIPKKHQTPIIKGDTLSISIAAASIIAKVYRDQVMTYLSKQYGHYFWHQNKGYGTKVHLEAIQKYGASPEHRVTFSFSQVQY